MAECGNDGMTTKKLKRGFRPIFVVMKSNFITTKTEERQNEGMARQQNDEMVEQRKDEITNRRKTEMTEFPSAEMKE